MNEHTNWRRVRKDRPCPICEKRDWCLLSADGSAAICARTESPKRCGDAGWLHHLADKPWLSPRQHVRTLHLDASTSPQAEMTRLAAECQRAVDPGRLFQFAVSLGLSTDSLVSLGIGWSQPHLAWAFPMRDAAGDVLGIRLRRSDGSKFAVQGGREGLFLSYHVLKNDMPMSQALVCEGATDTAALLDMGFANVIGRPSCTGGRKLLVDLARRRRPTEAVIV